MAQSSANDSDSNEVSDISSQLSEIKESYERKINELQNEFSQLKDLMMAVISKTDTENRQSTSKGPSKPTHTVGLDIKVKPFFHNGKLTSIRVVFRLSKTLFTLFHYDYVRIKCLSMTQNRKLLIFPSKMRDYIFKKCEQSFYLNPKLSH